MNEKNIIANKVDNIQNLQLCYTLLGSKEKQYFFMTDGKTECPICKLLVKNISLHMNKNPCINSIDADRFTKHF